MSLDFPTTRPEGRRIDDKRVGRKTEIRSYRLPDNAWERKDRSVFVGELRGAKVLSPRPEYDAEGVRIG
jgi:hypothetical protein